MPQSMQTPRPSWASREGIVMPSGPTSPLPGALPTDPLIVETLYRLALSLDEDNQFVIAQCFTVDASLTATVAGDSSLGTHEGREAVTGWLTTIWHERQAQQRLSITNAIGGTPEPESARITALFLLTAIAAGTLRTLTTGVLRAHMRKEPDNAWRISRLILGFDRE